MTKAELLAQILEDFSPDEKTLRINKSYQRIRDRDVIIEPKMGMLDTKVLKENQKFKEIHENDRRTGNDSYECIGCR